MTPRFSNVARSAGPLVAIFCESDEFHAACVDTLQRIVPPPLTTWSVVTEAAWLLHDQRAGLRRFCAPEGLFSIVPQGDEQLSEYLVIFERYRGLRPQLADVSLVQLAESRGFSIVFTWDRCEISVYRTKRKHLKLLPEF